MSYESTIVISRRELHALIDLADRALKSDSNDTEHGALYIIREKLVQIAVSRKEKK